MLFALELIVGLLVVVAPKLAKSFVEGEQKARSLRVLPVSHRLRTVAPTVGGGFVPPSLVEDSISNG